MLECVNVSPDSCVVWSKAVTQFLLVVQAEELNSSAPCPTLTLTLKHAIRQSVLGLHKSFSASPKTQTMSASVCSWHKINTLSVMDAGTKCGIVSGKTKVRMTLSMLLRLQIGLGCQIRLKNHIPEALQVHFTQAQTQERGAMGVSLVQSCWSLGALRGSGGLLSILSFQNRLRLLLHNIQLIQGKIVLQSQFNHTNLHS